ncbi:hypothetical protein SKAU_G00146080 [Synaphobranchus kaupii]|uniref:Chemokine interleukin-8-like domain-containing protein n=1 Tax=Synaphobranchus kaupii TaxID=118154 RepID=A0A9Q1J2L8_SYNKA|nr:hypothetical protein SKAU_G00146080 [Synaphobranchus kaupii]
MALNVSGFFIALLFLCGLDLDAEHMAVATSVRERCECVDTIDTMPWRRIRDFTVTNKGPLCNNIQIVLYLKKKDVCLNPDSKQGKRLQKCWKRIHENPAKKKGCLQRRRSRPKKTTRIL